MVKLVEKPPRRHIGSRWIETERNDFVRFWIDSAVQPELLTVKADHLLVDHLDLDAGTVYLPSRIQKGSPPPATLEVATDTVRLLRRYLRDRWKDTDALFPTRSRDRLTTRSLQRLVEKLATEADVRPQVAGGGVGEPDDITPHTLRHSVAYRIIQVDGGRLEDVQLRLRHANRQTTDQIYSHLVPR